MTLSKKSFAVQLMAVASALCCATAGAQDNKSGSSVTLFGILDTGVTMTNGLKENVAKKQLASGIMEGTRWGVKGTEDMGGGWKLLFTLESRVELDTGGTSNRPITGTQLPDRFNRASLLGLPPVLQPVVDGVANSLAGDLGVNVGAKGGRLFDRQAWVGLVTPVGAVLAGRQYTPAFETAFTFDTMKTESALSAAQVLAIPALLEIRQSNAISYRVEKSGFKGSAMVAQGDNGEDIGNASRLMGANASYELAGFTFGAAYNAANNELGKRSLTTAIFGAQYRMGASTFNAMMAKIKDDNPSNVSLIGRQLSASAATAGVAGVVQNAFTNALKQDGTLLHAGYRFTTGPNTISVAVNSYNDRRPANADVRSAGVAYTYALSKRTDLNAVAVSFVNSGLAQAAPGGNGYLGGVTRKAGEDASAFALGVRHRF
jgi:predicted porin